VEVKNSGDAKLVVPSKNRRRKQKNRSSPIDDDDDSLSDVLEQSDTGVNAGRCLRSQDRTVSERLKKRRALLEVDDNKDDDDEDYEPEAVSRPKRRKCRRQ